MQFQLPKQEVVRVFRVVTITRVNTVVRVARVIRVASVNFCTGFSRTCTPAV